MHIAAREGEPLERVLGKEIGKSIRELHESHGVVFHRGETIERLDGRKAILTKGTVVEVDFVVLGVGVRPAVTLAEKAGLKVDNGVVVDEFLETSAKGIFAAGDIARWPDARSGKPTRIEHWVVAERMGQTAARNMLGRKERFDAVPFFWTQQYDLTVRYTGHAEKWDSVEMDGSPQARLRCYVQARWRGVGGRNNRQGSSKSEGRSGDGKPDAKRLMSQWMRTAIRPM